MKNGKTSRTLPVSTVTLMGSLAITAALNFPATNDLVLKKEQNPVALMEILVF